MENSRPPFTPTTTTTSSSSFSTLDSSSSLSYYYPAVQNPPPHPSRQQQPFLPWNFPVYPSPVPNPYWQQQPFLPWHIPVYPSPVPSPAVDASVSRAAREERRMARQQRRFILSTRNDAHAASPSSRMGGERDATDAGSDAQNNEQDLYLFCTPGQWKLRFLFKKEIKKSDVGSWGRIVLPKREAEKYLPSLSDKEGIELMIKDALSNQEWGLTYK
ncbi:B3 domain-containing transcription factor LEC2 [Rosa chinensis]|uniref:B3 domain-containing transcription factor LEC2 n=1 Tax=Rosa chinensis TaxID=74649 RepID=UPI000D096D0D|nr:B3 domain-containing transcription factor LEC2 [Rosa chinensis]